MGRHIQRYIVRAYHPRLVALHLLGHFQDLNDLLISRLGGAVQKHQQHHRDQKPGREDHGPPLHLGNAISKPPKTFIKTHINLKTPSARIFTLLNLSLPGKDMVRLYSRCSLWSCIYYLT